MAIVRFLAMTAGELAQGGRMPERMAWMACHVSPYGRGLSNLPEALPPGSLLMVDDRNPIQGHDGKAICRQIEACVARFSCAGVLLDFQRPGNREAEALAALLDGALPCPLGVSALYGKGRQCAVCLPPPPCHVPLTDHLAPWQGQEVWMELAMEGQTILLTKSGAKFAPLCPPGPQVPFREERLHCHYAISPESAQVRFTLRRTREDLDALEQEAQALGVTKTLGLWQELSGGS